MITKQSIRRYIDRVIKKEIRRYLDYGVKGMKKGVRHEEPTSPTTRTSKPKAKKPSNNVIARNLRYMGGLHARAIKENRKNGHHIRAGLHSVVAAPYLALGKLAGAEY
jgi:hypothetical protein